MKRFSPDCSPRDLMSPGDGGDRLTHPPRLPAVKVLRKKDSPPIILFEAAEESATAHAGLHLYPLLGHHGPGLGLDFLARVKMNGEHCVTGAELYVASHCVESSFFYVRTVLLQVYHTGFRPGVCQLESQLAVVTCMPQCNSLVEREQRTHTEEFYEFCDGELEIAQLNRPPLNGYRLYCPICIKRVQPFDTL